MISDGFTQWTEQQKSGEEQQPFSNSNINQVDGFIVSLHSIRQSPEKTIRKEDRLNLLYEGEEGELLKISPNKKKTLKKDIKSFTHISNVGTNETVEKKYRKQYYKQMGEQQKKAFKTKKDNFKLDIFSQAFERISLQLQKIDSTYLRVIINSLQNKDYIVSDYLKSGGEADILQGQYLNEFNEEEECVFRITNCSNNDIVSMNEEYEIMNTFKFSNHTVNLIERIVLEDIQIIIQVIKKCKNSLLEEMNPKTNNSFSYRQLIYIISNLIDSIVELRIHEILHLDIKPGNILKNNQNIYVFSDFGMSVKSNEKGVQVKGCTPKYCSKEQILGKQVTYLSDVYSLGQTIKELIDFSILQQKKEKIKHRLTKQQKKILLQIKDFILKKMTNEQFQDREDCIELIFQFYEIIGKKNFVMQRYFKQKIRMIPFLEQFQNRDIKFMKILELKYSILYLQIFIDQYNLDINVNDISNDNNKIEIQTIKHSGINMIKYLKYVAMISCLYFTTGEVSKSIATMNHCQNILNTTIIKESVQSSQVIFQLGSLCFEIGHSYFMNTKCEKSVETYLKFLSTHQKLYKERPNQFNVELVKESIQKCYSRVEDQKQEIKNQNENDLRKKIENYELSYHLLPSSLSCLANYYEIIPNFKIAYKYQKEAVLLREKVINENQNQNYLSIIEAKLSLGNIMRQLSLTKEAHEQYLGAIQIYTKYYSNGYHQNLADVYLQLGVNCLHRGQFQMALFCQIKSLQIKLNSYSDMFHPYIAQSLYTMGNLFQIYGYLEEGLKLAKMSYYISLKNKNDNNIMGLANFRLGNSLLLYGKPKIALIYNKLSVIQYQIRHSNCVNQRDIARCLLKVGLSYLRSGYLKKGLKYCKKSQYMYYLLFQNNIIYPFVAEALDGVAECYLSLKYFSQSYIHLQLSLKIRLLIYPKHHPDIATSYFLLGQYYEAIINFKKSLEYHQLAHEIRSRSQQFHNQLLELSCNKIFQLNEMKKIQIQNQQNQL